MTFQIPRSSGRMRGRLCQTPGRAAPEDGASLR